MQTIKSPVRVLLAAVMASFLGLSALALAAEPEASPPKDNRLLLALIEKAMADDPELRTQLNTLLARVESEEVVTLRKAVETRDLAIQELEAELDSVSRDDNSPELGTQPTEQPELVTGTLTIDNRCPYFVRVRINDQMKSIGPGQFNFPVTVDKAIGTVSTELVGHESPKNWKLTPPDYKTTFVIRP